MPAHRESVSERYSGHTHKHTRTSLRAFCRGNLTGEITSVTSGDRGRIGFCPVTLVPYCSEGMS